MIGRILKLMKIRVLSQVLTYYLDPYTRVSPQVITGIRYI
eukprot:UN16176